MKLIYIVAQVFTLLGIWVGLAEQYPYGFNFGEVWDQEKKIQKSHQQDGF